MYTKRSGQRTGMTLVEILFAFAIISSVVVLSYASGLRGWRTAQTGNQRTQAQYMAQDAIERVKAYRDSPDFKWTGAASLTGQPGTGGFLNDIAATGGSDHAFYVENCVSPETCTLKIVDVNASGASTPGTPSHAAIKKPDEAQKVSDSTDFYIYLVIKQHFLLDATGATTNQPKPGFPGILDDKVQAVTIEARVEWKDATGIVSNAVATTILTDNVNTQVAYVASPVPLPTTLSTLTPPTPTPTPTPTLAPTPTPPPVVYVYYCKYIFFGCDWWPQ